MFDIRRQYHRFDCDTIVEFRPLKNANEYSVGITKDFSSAGFSFESQHYDLEPEEDLEFKLIHPNCDLFVSVQGKAVWKEESEFACVTGIELEDLDKTTRKKMAEIVSATGSTPDDSFHLKRSIDTKKEYLKNKNVCRVTFTLPKIAAPDAKSVCIVGDFNNWNTHANPMKKLKNGDYTIKLDLEPGQKYQFRYFIDESKWENDWNADKYVRSIYGDCDNSVVIVDALD